MRMRGCVSAGLAMLVLALVLLSAACYAEKRAEMSPAPFVMGSRYGRSPHRLVAPRNDRFFMGSRYGKRSDARLEAGSGAVEGWGGSRELLCEYTGVFPLYRCASRDHARLERRSNSEETLPGESD